MDLNSRSRRHLEWLIHNQPELVRDLHNSNKLEERLEERYQKALELTDRFKQERGMSDEEAFEAASDLVLAPAEKDPLAQKGQPISKEEREAIYRKLEAMAIAQERPLSRESLENV